MRKEEAQMGRRLFDDLVVSGHAGAGLPRPRAWPLSLAVHAMAVAVLASVSVKVVKEEDAPPPGPVVFRSSPRPQASSAPTVRAGTPAPRRIPRKVPMPVDPLPVVRADNPGVDVEPDVLEPPAGDLPLCLGCVAGAPGGGDGASPDGPAGPAGSGDGAGIAPRPVGGEIREPRRIQGGAPPYPELARRAHVEGKVVLECVIDERGRVRNVRIVSGHPLLADSAAEAVGAWIYTPTTLNGQPVAVILNVTVKFGLERH
jgi:protein TonB